MGTLPLFFNLHSHGAYDSFLKVSVLSYLTTPAETLCTIEACWIKPSKIVHENIFLRHYFSSRGQETVTLRLTVTCYTCVPLSEDFLFSRMSHKNINYFLMLVMKNAVSVFV